VTLHPPLSSRTRARRVRGGILDSEGEPLRRHDRPDAGRRSSGQSPRRPLAPVD
jgi:hypothetical protein